MNGSTPYTALITQIATALALDPTLLEAQVVVESSGQPDAFRYEPAYYHQYIQHNLNAKGYRQGPLAACSYGLLQILYETALETGFVGQPADLFQPYTGLWWGGKYLAGLLTWSHDDYPTALAAYNAGKGNTPAGLPYVRKIYTQAGRPLSPNLSPSLSGGVA